MTQVAQNIDDDNRVLTKKNQELKIQYLSQENDRDLLLRQLIHQKKESAKLSSRQQKSRTSKPRDSSITNTASLALAEPDPGQDIARRT